MAYGSFPINIGQIIKPVFSDRLAWTKKDPDQNALFAIPSGITS